MNRLDKITARYMAETIGGSLLFVLASYWAAETGRAVQDQAVHVFAAVAAMVPMACVFWAIVRYYRQVDERERMIMATSGAITLLIAVFGALLLAKLENVMRVNLNNFAAFLLVSWTLATIGVRWRS